jgi:hypothetical protein
VQGSLIAALSDNTPHGYNLTFAFPMLMFIIVAGALYLRFRSPHRVPGHVSLAASRWARAQHAAGGPAQAPATEPARPAPAAEHAVEEQAAGEIAEGQE